MSKLKIAINPWDFTLYKCDDSYYVMKVIFSEGDYKVDVERYFIVTDLINSNETEGLKKISSEIRSNYAVFKDKEISKKDFNLI